MRDEMRAAAPSAAFPPEGRDAARLSILFMTSDGYPPFRPAAKAIFTGGLPSRGHSVDWLQQAADASVPGGAFPCPGGIAYVAPTTAAHSRLGRLWKHWLALRNDLRVFGLLARGNYSLVQVKDKYIGALIALIAAKRHGVPVFYWLAYPHAEASLHAAREGVARYTLWYALRGRLQRWLLYRIIMPACAHVFVQSEQMKLDIQREGIPREAMTAVPSSVNLTEFDRVLEEAPPAEPAAQRSIVYLGTLLRERRLDFLIRVLCRVLPQFPDARLVYVGKGENQEDEDFLVAEASRLGVASQVTITGWLPMEEAWRRCRAASVCISPYRPIPILRSTSPTKLVEYMALGKAVVANDHPEQSDVLRACDAGLVCGWNESEFADAIVRLLGSPERCAQMGRNGRRFVERHRTHAVLTETVLGRYRDVLNDLVGGTAAASIPATAPRAAGQARD